MYRVTLEELPHGEEAKAHVIGKAMICNLMMHEKGSELGSFHGHFATDGGQEINAFAYDYRRREGVPWDLIGTLLQNAGHGAKVDA
jgi:hypothetical protein